MLSLFSLKSVGGGEGKRAKDCSSRMKFSFSLHTKRVYSQLLIHLNLELNSFEVKLYGLVFLRSQLELT